MLFHHLCSLFNCYYSFTFHELVLKILLTVLLLDVRHILSTCFPDDSLREAMYPLHHEQSRSLESDDKKHKSKVDSEARSQSLESDLQKTPVITNVSVMDMYRQKGKQLSVIIFLGLSKCKRSSTAMPLWDDHSLHCISM